MNDFSDLKLILFLGGGAALLLGVLGLVIRSAVRGGGRSRMLEHDEGDAPATPLPPGIPVLSRGASLPPAPPATSSTGRYRVVGVDRTTRMEVTGVYEASTPANAKVKAELEGVVVTDVQPA